MELKLKDVYRVECDDFLSPNLLSSFLSLYQPLLGNNATLLYLTLYSEGRNQRTQESHQRLSSLMDKDTSEIERARIRLEEFLLVKTYLEEQDTRNVYVYVLRAPVSADYFFQNSELRNLYAEVMGPKQTELSMAKFQMDHVSINGYKDITRIVKHQPKKADYDTDVVYQQVKPTYRFSDEEIDIVFDYDQFFSTTSTLVFPAELRSEENLRLIGRLATVHGLSVDKMRVLVKNCVDINRMRFDDKKLRFLAEKSVPDITEAKDPYQLPPVSFLQAKQNGAAVTLADRKILEYLAMQMHFSPEVINVMIEYILETSDHKLIPKFVEMVAGEWARAGIKTKEEALAATKKKPSSYGKKKNVAPLPEYRNQPEQAINKATQEDIEEVQSLLKNKRNAK